MGRTIIVSNRLPVTAKQEEGSVQFVPSVGGLATGLRSVHASGEGRWVGWPGIAAEALRGKEGTVCRNLAELNCVPVSLTPRDVRDYYGGFSNRTIWPLFHYFTQHATYDRDHWAAYRRVNERFAAATAEIAEPGDTVWVQDYHLMLVPALVRARLPAVRIGFFLHIPFPSYEVFRLLPWRKEILEGLLGADLVGFHTHDYVGHFLDAVHAILGRGHAAGNVEGGERPVRADAFPMGIDYDRFRTAAEAPAVRREVGRIERHMGDRQVILSVDRLDYTKGVLERLEAFDLFLTENPSWRERVTLVLLLVPSRTRVEEYRDLKRKIDERVGRINGRHGSVGWIPIGYLYRSVPFERLVALYRAADVALVTPLRDGMNLVAKEYVACQVDGDGVLVLSEFAGAAQELGEALLVNPNDVPGMARAIGEALQMPRRERAERMRRMAEWVADHTVEGWAADFLAELAAHRLPDRAPQPLGGDGVARLDAKYAAAEARLLFLDYDGTLVPFAAIPGRAKPDRELRGLLARLAQDARNEVVIVSGRDRETLTAWLGDLDLALVAEHGAWVRERGGAWRATVARDGAWKQRVRPLLDRYVRRTPGACVEEKSFSLAWHYRRAEPYASQLRAPELRAALRDLAAELDLHVLEGDHVLEVKAGPFHKGHAAAHWLDKPWGFVLAAGDDRTDEDLFGALPRGSWTIKVGGGPSRAEYSVPSPREVRALLARLAGRR
ncbi:MAG: Alpha,alpha-trehalose-phosphate synthase [UDP-forming] [Candidatus Bipolaricaulis sibiricus]|uniref:Alpha,alpha-trehalose-phosphate synthase n=1 Tax=Bipolaricaulis sibiricus TaxID=2501609 RepID=A0A410FUX4_BIPS1|nr:MAG: Alpha,alpha-trehalose-phosphate synthase [UDP-forming] [Candidatus Bipolaricaulis sibiricus]